MSTIVATNIPEVNDLMETDAERELWIVVKEHERSPFWHAGEGVGCRLNKAARVLLDGRLCPNSDGSYTITGSEGRTYRVDKHCSCPDSQYRQKTYCYHMVSVALYVEWNRRMGHPTLQGALPLPPVTVDERLSAPPVTPQEARGEESTPMADASSPAPEDDRVATSVLEPPRVSADPAPFTIPREFTVSIQGRMHVLYAGLLVAARHAGMQTLAADWTFNSDDLSLAHAICTFADGRRYEDSGDATPQNVSKGIAKHFRRVALTRAKARCLRDALGIQECSVEELAVERETPTPATKPSSADLRRRIWALVNAADATITTREACEHYVQRVTGLALEPNNYGAIVAKLEQGR